MSEGWSEGRRLLRNLGVGLGIFVAGGAVALLAARPAGDDVPSTAASAGPQLGADLASYEADRREALAGEGSGLRPAVVSFTDYVGDDEVARLLPVEPRRYLVAVPGHRPEETGDLERWRAERVEEARREVEELSRYLDDSAGVSAEFRRQYEADVARATAAAEALEAGEAVVYAAVVVARVDTLRALAVRADVRLVDVVSGDAARARGLRPEERRVAGEPPERP